VGAVLPEGLDERFRELRRRPKERSALRADRQAAVERLVFGTGHGLWIPEVPLQPAHHEPPPRLVDEPRKDHVLAGLDASGRPVLVRGAFGRLGEAPAAVVAHPSESADTWVISVRLLTWDGHRVEIVGFLTHDDVSHVTWVDHDERGRAVRFATAGVHYNALGKGAAIATCEWEDDRCVRVRSQTSEDGRRWREAVDEAEYDQRGLARIHGDGRVVWDRELHGFEDDPLAPDEALDAWTRAVAAAAARVARRAGAADPAVVKVSSQFRGVDPCVVMVERAYLESAAAHVDPREAIGQLWEPRHDLLPEVDADGLRALRSLRQQLINDGQPAAGEALMRRLAEESWPGDAIPFAPGFGRDMWEVAERVLGPERLGAVLGSLPAPVPTPAIERPPASTIELAGLLGQFGLSPDLAQQAAWGLVLASGGRGRSRLGGRAELPDGMAWPVHEGRVLTHLATIVLSELPDFDGRDALPAAGDLLFFADLTEEGELWEPTVVGDDERVQIIEIAEGTPVREVTPPRDDRDEYDPPAVLRRRKVAFRPVLTIPEEPAGVDAAHRYAYDKLFEATQDFTPGHMVLGHPVVVQGDPREPGQMSLLHIGWDEALGFEFLDAGDLTFHGDAADVRAGRWDRLTISPSSC
jgi:uncharacterized protein DUF1963